MSSIIVPPIRSPLTDPGPDSAKGRASRAAAQRTAIQTATRDWYLFFEKLTRGLQRLDSSVNEGTHEERLAQPPGNAPDGALWVETDRGNVIYQVQLDADDQPQWVYLIGTMTAALADKPMDLADGDTGFLFLGADYAHTWRWIGTAWEYAPGDRISGEIAWFTTNPGIGWALCNGAATTRTTPGAGTAAFTTPNLIGCYARGGAAYTGAAIAATAPGLTGSTGIEASHTHSVTTVTIASAQSTDPDIVWNSGTTGFYVAKDNAHTHQIPGQTVNSGAGSAHNHGKGTLAVDAAGEPAHVDLLPYFRL